MIVLGIDPGRTSGWALAVSHETIIASGAGKSAAERRDAVREALHRAEGETLRVAMEWVPAFGGSKSTAIGIGQARGRWLETLELVAGYTERRVHRVTPDQWRRATHGLVRAKGETRQDREHMYKAAACAFTGIEHPDAAEAACIAMWCAGQLGLEAA